MLGPANLQLTGVLLAAPRWTSPARPTAPLVATQIRDCAQEDDRSMSLASGRYMEVSASLEAKCCKRVADFVVLQTIGFLSVSGLDADEEVPLQFGRRYLDQNRNSYIYHAGPDFDTRQGKEISQDLGRAAGSFNITTVYGVAPRSESLSRATWFGSNPAADARPAPLGRSILAVAVSAHV